MLVGQEMIEDTINVVDLIKKMMQRHKIAINIVQICTRVT